MPGVAEGVAWGRSGLDAPVGPTGSGLAATASADRDESCLPLIPMAAFVV